MNRPLFHLGPRLALCASFVREGVRVADIGTDHAYLPVWLVKEGKVSYAIAADVKTGPLRRAERNVARYHVEDCVSLRLSDGLEAVFPLEADDIILAGMGGETIAEILSRAPWLKDREKHLILQPMTSAEELRRYLRQNGFAVQREEAACEGGHCYSVMLAWYAPHALPQGELYEFAGLLRGENAGERAYLTQCAARLQKKAEGLARAEGGEDPARYFALAEQIRRLAGEGEQR